MLELKQEAAPASPAATYLRPYNDSTQKTLALLDEYGQTGFCSRFLGQTTTSVSSTTTAETKSIVGTIVGTFTIKANHAVIGKKLRLKAKGVLTTGGTASTITFQVKWAGTVIASTGAVAPTISQNNMYWEAECEIVIRTIGATGTVFCQGNVHVQNAATPAAGVNWPIRGNSADPPAATTVDTTANSLIDAQTITGNNLHTWTTNMVDLEEFN